MTYEIDIAGLKRDLPICKVTDDLYIGAFVIFGDVELTVHCAAELLKRAPDYDYLIAPEAKAIPLLYEMARQSGADKYFLARKKAKAYMSGVMEVEVQSITTAGKQTLVIDTEDAKQIAGKRMLILDDVISTGESLHAMEVLVEKCGGNGDLIGGIDQIQVTHQLAYRGHHFRGEATAEFADVRAGGVFRQDPFPQVGNGPVADLLVDRLIDIVLDDPGDFVLLIGHSGVFPQIRKQHRGKDHLRRHPLLGRFRGKTGKFITGLFFIGLSQNLFQ